MTWTEKLEFNKTGQDIRTEEVSLKCSAANAEVAHLHTAGETAGLQSPLASLSPPLSQ